IGVASAQAQPSFRAAAGAAATGTPVFRAASSAAIEPIGFRGAASAATDTATLTVSVPSGVVENDVLIAAISVRPASASITPPSGWTLVRRVDQTSGQPSALAVYRRVAGSSEPSSYDWGFSGASYAAGGIQAFFNVDTANPIDVENGQATAYSLRHATPSIPTTVANAVLVTAHSFPTSTTWTPPSGMTEAFDAQFQPVGAGQGQSISGHYVLQSSAGSTGAKTATAA